MAILTNSINNPVVGLQLKYDDVKVNSGAGYNKNHGNFVAPVNGSYFFSFTASVKPDGGSLRIYMKKSDGSIVGHLLFLGNTFYVKESENIVIHLNKGEEVWTEIGMTSGTIHIHGTEEGPVSTYIHTHFSGFRIGD
ncbi:hypothetical protein FSP39_015990 [Pinctada imbricata]|uniref:C1q domain-containing protein n=1 Tax=Pinctada imbricata TaxID=66713 RepID=A0AA88Y821_PINIB|nr:hypothetical protein FSP39_015990 [Pinctada imbricata]